MKTTFKCGRGSKTNGLYSAKHLDREFDTEKTKHIHPELSKENFYVRFELRENGHVEGVLDNEKGFYQHELDVYEKLLADRIKSINDNYTKTRQENRHTSAEKIYSSRKTCPEEVIMQFGTAEQNQNISILKYRAMLSEYVKWHTQTYPNVKILDAAVHMDETTRHIHLRQMWTYTNDKGQLDIGQSKALAQMGIERPNLNEDRSKFNNAKMTYTSQCREQWRQIGLRHGLELDEIEHGGKSGVELNEYINQKLISERQSLELGQLTKNDLQIIKNVLHSVEDLSLDETFAMTKLDHLLEPDRHRESVLDRSLDELER